MSDSMADIRSNFNDGFNDALAGEPFDTKCIRFIGYAEGYSSGGEFKDEYESFREDSFALYFLER